MFRAWLDRFDTLVMKNIARVALLAMMFTTSFDALGRYLFDRPIQGAVALVTEFLFPVVVFFSVSYVFLLDGHVRVELVRRKFSPRTRVWLEILFTVLTLVLWALVAERAGARAYEGYVLKQRPIGVFGIPPTVAYGVVAIGGLVMVLRMIAHGLEQVRFLLDGAAASQSPPESDAADELLNI